MREVLEFFLQEDDTKYQLRAELREAVLAFSLTVKNSRGMLYEAGEAKEREGDLESYDDCDGQSHLVRIFKFRGPDSAIVFGLDVENEYLWVLSSSSPDEKEGLTYTCPIPLLRVYG